MPRRPLIAMADDDHAHAAILSAYLEMDGFDVVRFESGDALLEWAGGESASADAFLLDVEMPGRDGFQTCRELRGIKIFRETPAVICSSLAVETMLDRVREAGATWAVRKAPELLPRLSDWLSIYLKGTLDRS